MARFTRNLALPGFIVDRNSIDLSNGGRMIDWANVASSYVNPRTGYKELPAGTCVGDLLGAGKLSPRVVTTNPAAGFLLTNATEDPNSPDALSGYGFIRGGSLYENLLPDSSGSPRVLLAAIKTELNTAGATKGFLFEKYQDAR